MTFGDPLGDRRYIKLVTKELVQQGFIEGTEAFGAEFVRSVRGKISEELLQAWCKKRGFDPDKIL